MSRRNVDPARRRKPSGEETERTRQRILDAARSLLQEGRFHAASMEEIADEAGLSRAGLYLHFRSRTALIDAICETLDESPELLALHELVRSGEPREALHRIIEINIRFWANDEPMFRQLYGSAAIDDAAQDFVDRQTQDRTASLKVLAQRLQRAGHLRPGLRRQDALAQLLLITSFSTYVELRRNGGLPDAGVVRVLRAIVDDNVLASEP
jgi:AcrR family transcriptional regulator